MQLSLTLADSLLQVTQLASYFDPLVVASVGLASKLHDHQQQMTILDQSKTLSESALQMLYAAKEGGGNPKVISMLRRRAVSCVSQWAVFSKLVFFLLFNNIF